MDINWEIVSKLGAPLFLAVSLSIGIFMSAVWLVKNLLKAYQAERKDHQLFLSDAVKANTEIIRQLTERINENNSSLSRFIDNFSDYIIRMENADRYQREEHIKLQKTLDTSCIKIDNIQNEIRKYLGD